ncbi:MAG: tetratricopeptide repeat protein [Peptococcaceae bacterium]|jgi:tetratricopeptide (TPR) repeat protein|nr:tetratricopeptide repeat protein [Peptococcaceae bacterium]
MVQHIISHFYKKKKVVSRNYFLRKCKAILRFRFGNAEWAAKEFIQLLRESGSVSNLAIAKRLIQAQVYEEVLEYLFEQLEGEGSQTDRAEIKYLIACCHLNQGQIRAAKQAMEEALLLCPERTEFYEVMTSCLLEAGDWRGAIETLRKALLFQPKQSDLLYRLGTILALHGEKEDALRSFQGCCHLDKHHPLFWEAKGEIHLQLEQIEQACVCYEKAWLYGAKPEALARVAYCHIQMNRIAKGIKNYKKVLKYEPDHYDALCNLAAVYENQNRSQEALQLLEKALTLQANDAILLNNMAYTLVRLGRLRKAAERYQEALQLGPKQPLILYNYSVCLAKKGNWEEGITVLKELLAVDQDHAEGWALLGNIHDELSNYETAVDCYNRSLALA